MAITTIDGAKDGVQFTRFVQKVPFTAITGRSTSTWGISGLPAAGVYDTTLAGVALTAPVTGQLNFLNPISGNTYLAEMSSAYNLPALVFLVDRLWHNGGLTITQTTAQTINSATWPARDANGTTNGDGVMIGIEVSAACGAAAPAPTISYTNQAGTAGRSAGLWFPTANSPAAGAFYQFGLQAGDTGVRSIQTYTQNTSWVSGTINLVAYRIISMMDIPLAGVRGCIDAITSGFPRMYDGSVPFIMIATSNGNSAGISARVTYTQG